MRKIMLRITMVRKASYEGNLEEPERLAESIIAEQNLWAGDERT